MNYFQFRMRLLHSLFHYYEKLYIFILFMILSMNICFLSLRHGCWHPAASMLEQRLFLQPTHLANNLTLSPIDCLSELYASMNEKVRRFSIFFDKKNSDRHSCHLSCLHIHLISIFHVHSHFAYYYIIICFCTYVSLGRMAWVMESACFARLLASCACFDSIRLLVSRSRHVLQRNEAVPSV